MVSVRVHRPGTGPANRRESATVEALSIWTPATVIDRAPCWSCGDLPAIIRPDGLCGPCGLIDPDEVPDIHDPAWAGNTKPLEAIFVAPPNARTVR